MGTGFIRATAVTFNGTPASFRVINATSIVEVVPVGATTGPVSVAGTATRMPATSLNVVVSNLAVGTYQFGFMATDQAGASSVEDFVVLQVPAAATTPPSSAGGTYAAPDYFSQVYSS